MTRNDKIEQPLMLQPECVDCKWYDGFGQCLEHGNHLKDNCEDFEVCYEEAVKWIDDTNIEIVEL